MRIFAAIYRGLQHRRGWLLLVLLMLLVWAGWFLPQVKIEESISAMLPDGKSRVAHDFQLLQQAPFARKVVISLTAEADIEQDLLLEVTERIVEALPSELFTNILSGPDSGSAGQLYTQVGNYLPRLLDADDLREIEKRLRPEQVDTRLANALAQLLQPQGVALKNEIRRDPLQLKDLALGKLAYLNPIPGVRIEQGHFISADGRHSLILADTPIQITDSAGAKALIDAFDQASKTLPEGISAQLVSGHPYTLANSSAIQADMQRVLLVSGIGILLLFLLFLRSLRALSVYLLPLFSMLIALMVAATWFDSLSGITVGFGAVLLGITIDFGLHVYFALRSGDGTSDVDQLLEAVTRPVLFGGLTSLAAFAVLLRSDLPGQRQLAIFAIAGIVAALLLALIFLPHFIGAQQRTTQPLRHKFRRHIYDRSPALRISVLVVWLIVVSLSAWQAQSLSINGELKQLSYLPVELQQAEQQLSENWGNMRGRALLFAEGADLETALQRNEQAWQLLNDQGLKDDVVSLAPLLASQKTQQQRLRQWEEFWQQHKATTLDLFQSSGQNLGFTAAAFTPFWSMVDAAPAALDLELLQSWGLGRMLDGLLLKNEQGYQVLTLLPDNATLIQTLESELDSLEGLTLVSQSRFGRQLSAEIGTDFSRFISLAGLIVLLLLIVLFRCLADVLLALLPVLSGLLVMFGCMGWLNLEMNLFNVIASILIIGLGVDYGIFMVCHNQQEIDLASSRAILISGLTTLVGFGALVLAEHPALYSIGLTVLLGISAAVPTAIFVIPAFRPKRC